jgi:hypothetical protein
VFVRSEVRLVEEMDKQLDLQAIVKIVPVQKQVQVPMFMKQQMFVDVPQVEFVEKIVHVPEQQQTQALVSHVPNKKKEKQEKAKLPRQGGPAPLGGSEKQDTARLPRQGGVGVVKELVSVQPAAVDLIDKDLEDQIADNFELEGKELGVLLKAGKISVEEFSDFLSRGVQRLSVGLPHESFKVL